MVTESITILGEFYLKLTILTKVMGPMTPFGQITNNFRTKSKVIVETLKTCDRKLEVFHSEKTRQL